MKKNEIITSLQIERAELKQRVYELEIDIRIIFNKCASNLAALINKLNAMSPIEKASIYFTCENITVKELSVLTHQLYKFHLVTLKPERIHKELRIPAYYANLYDKLVEKNYQNPKLHNPLLIIEDQTKAHQMVFDILRNTECEIKKIDGKYIIYKEKSEIDRKYDIYLEEK